VLALVVLVGLVGIGTAPLHESVRRPTPGGLRPVAATSTTVRLAWDAVSGSPRYRVAFATSPAMAGARTMTFDDNHGTLEGLRPGRTYWVRVAAADTEGHTLSGYTAPSYPSARTLYRGGYGFRAPAKVTLTGTRLRSLSLDWSPVAQAPGYRVTVAPDDRRHRARTHWFGDDKGTIGHLRPGRRYVVSVSVARRASASRALSRPTRAKAVATRTAVPASYDLRVVSWNITGSRNAPWTPRRSTVVRQLAGLSPGDQVAPPPDAIALQEANTSRAVPGGGTQYAQVIAGLNATAPGAHYSGLYSNSNATRIAWNDTTLDLVGSGVLYFRAQELHHDGARMAPWAVLEVKRTHARFFFLSAHLETSSEGVRRAQWSELVARVPALSHGLPVVLGGDFNSPRHAGDNPSAGAMLGRMRAAGFGDTLGQVGPGMVTWAGSRAATVVKANFNSVNRFHRAMGGYGAGLVGQDVDYLFASNALRVKRWEMVVASSGRTIVGTIGSDHNMIRATIGLPTPAGG
jgi:endonuclease/exonuclease/phosphatase family metal-dependent hydrolase